MKESDEKCRLAVVILNWEKPRQTIRCAESLVDQFDELEGLAESRLVIVDNGSRGADARTLNTWIDRVAREEITLVSSQSNLGFSGGMNLGMGSLGDFSPDYYWLLNNDLTVDPGSLSLLLRAAKSRDDVVIWGPTVVEATSGKVQCAGGSHYQKWFGLESPSYAGISVDVAKEMPARKYDYIYGAAMFLKADFLDALGGLNEEYFLFYEELDLAMRVKEEQQLAWCKHAVVRHTGSASSESSRAYRAFTAYHAAFSGYRFTLQYFPMCLPTTILARVVGLAVKSIADGNARLALAPWRALIDFLLGRKPNRTLTG